MKKLVEMLPFILLTALVGFVFFKEPSIAQSIIISAISALAGYKYFLLDKKKPDYLKIFEEQLSVIDKNYKEDSNFIRAELANINKKYGKVAIEQNQAKRIQKSSGW